MLRGKRKHGRLLQTTDQGMLKPITEQKKTIDKKYEALVCRYYYYTKLHGLKFDDMIKLLEDEFFISGGRIIDVIAERADKVSALVEARPTIKQLAELLPQFNWQAPVKQAIKRVAFVN